MRDRFSAEDPHSTAEDDDADAEADEHEDGSRDPDELTDEPQWWDEGSDDEG
jgi:hypothetical protein